MESQQIKVVGMSCGHCTNAVHKAVMSLDGVKEAKVDLPSGTVDIQYDAAKVDLKAIRTAIEEAGYDVV